jgi:drug/metabolite transporter (DMT)-like permease
MYVCTRATPSSYASVYQMLRGTLVLFAGMFTVVILRRRLFSHHWLGMVLITAGAALVGASSIIYAQDDAVAGAHNGLSLREQAALLPHLPAHVWQVLRHGKHGGGGDGGSGGGAAAAATAAAPLFGDVLVVCAQAFTALQFILEEKFLVQYKVPALLAVGLEGCWGFALCALAMPVLTFVRGGDGLPIDDAAGAAREVLGNGALAAAILVSVFSIACFNFFGGWLGGARDEGVPWKWGGSGPRGRVWCCRWVCSRQSSPAAGAMLWGFCGPCPVRHGAAGARLGKHLFFPPVSALHIARAAGPRRRFGDQVPQRRGARDDRRLPHAVHLAGLHPPRLGALPRAADPGVCGADMRIRAV